MAAVEQGLGRVLKETCRYMLREPVRSDGLIGHVRLLNRESILSAGNCTSAAVKSVYGWLGESRVPGAGEMLCDLRCSGSLSDKELHEVGSAVLEDHCWQEPWSSTPSSDVLRFKS